MEERFPHTGKPFRLEPGWVWPQVVALLFAFSSADFTALRFPKALAEETADAPIQVVVKQGLLTLDVADAPLSDVLQAVGKEAQIRVSIRGDLNKRTTDSFADTPIDEGLRRLLRGRSFALSYLPSTEKAGSPRLTEVSVIANSAAQRVQPQNTAAARNRRREWLQAIQALGRQGDEDAFHELARIALRDSDPVMRRQAVASLGRLGNAKAAAPLAAALADQSASVRIQAIRAIRNLKGEDAVVDLHRIVTEDANPRVRREAARRLAGIRNEAALSALEQANRDPDPAVRREAIRVMRRWERSLAAAERRLGIQR